MVIYPVNLITIYLFKSKIKCDLQAYHPYKISDYFLQAAS